MIVRVCGCGDDVSYVVCNSTDNHSMLSWVSFAAGLAGVS